MSVHRLLNITFILILIALFKPFEVTAQQLRYNFKNYTPSDGLPSSEVYQVLQDSYHYMWFATDHGICRYNGYEFVTFNLADNSILGIYEDSKKRIWAYSFSGRLFYYENGEFKDYKWNEKLSGLVKPGVISAIYIDSNDVVHIVASGPNYYTISAKGEIERFTKLASEVKCNARQITKRDFFTVIYEYPSNYDGKVKKREKSSEIVINTEGNKKLRIQVAHTIQPERYRIKKTDDKTFFFYSVDCVIKILNDGSYIYEGSAYSTDDIECIDSSYYYATGDGLVIKNSNGKIIDEYLKGIHVTSIEKDYEGGLWISTLSNGVYYVNLFQIKHLAFKEKIIEYKSKALIKIDDENLVAAIGNNEILKVNPGKSIEKKKLNVADIVSFYKYENNNILVGSSVNLFDSNAWVSKDRQRIGAYNLIVVGQNSNFIRKGDTLFSGTTGSLLAYRYQDLRLLTKSPKNYFRVSKVFLTHMNEILIGNQFGLWSYRNESLIPYESSKEILRSRITDINEYKNQFLCIGTRGKGLLVEINDSLYEINTSKGIVSNNIRRIFTENNHIWLATNSGITILSIESVRPFRYSVKNLSVQDGLLSNEVNDIIDDRDNVIVATNAGISFLNKNKVITKKSYPLQFYITSVTINGKFAELRDLEKLEYQKRNISVKFDALNFSSPGRNNFRYRLLGYDSNWIYTNDRAVQLNPVPYGDYVLQIQAKREFDSWIDNEITLPFSVSVKCEIPFWLSVWFYFLVTMLIVAIVFFFFTRRISAFKKRQAERDDFQRKISETEQMALKAQMNPHFIFNCLNSIQQYVIDRDVQGANKFITGFSKLIRQTLDFSSKDLITLEEEIAYLFNYLELEKARMENSFDYQIKQDLKHGPFELQIQPMLLQPYVENALRHGIKHLKDGNGLIKLAFTEKNETMECIIEDNGIGRKKAQILKSNNPIEYQSKGMTLTAERVKLINQSKQLSILIKVEDVMNTAGNVAGTKVTLVFPL